MCSQPTSFRRTDVERPTIYRFLAKCSICGGPLYRGDPAWKGGNNAEPVNNGRCCSDCNEQVVIPVRRAMIDGRTIN